MAVWPRTSATFSPTLVLLTFLSAALVVLASQKGVTYDHRSLIINGKRELLFSGSIHYPRSTPEMWPDLIRKAKQGGLNAIETYVFWNIHEPQFGKFNFEGRFDIVKFIKLVQQEQMYMIVRFGPFVQGEWNHGALPYWLRDVPDILFRTDNEPFKFHMKRYVDYMVKILKSEKLFASQGGPIVLAQIENEYNNIAEAYDEAGVRYIKWAANLALNYTLGIPWVMCKQNDAPGSVIETCNGRHCGDTWSGPKNPKKPYLWTENWTAQYRVFGDPPSQRSAEDLAYSVARWFSKKGTMTNYYMYHGGTNLERTGASYMLTKYYDEAPLDEYGLKKEPKWGHLKDVHQALRLCRNGILRGKRSVQVLGHGYEARLFEQPKTNTCVAFLTNTNKAKDGTVNFRGVEYYLPHQSISILPDCKTVVFNTQKVNAQHNSRTYNVAKESFMNNQWHMYREDVPKRRNTRIISDKPLEMYNITKDTTDYLWYTTSIKLDDEDLSRRGDKPVLVTTNYGHAMHAFVNGKYIGSQHGAKGQLSFIFKEPMVLKPGRNDIQLLTATFGMQDSGSYLEHRLAGLHTVAIQGLNTGTLDLSQNYWGHKAGLIGEKLSIFTPSGAKHVSWDQVTNNVTLTWYKRHFDAPNGNDPVALDLSSMGKGLAWVNGHGIGRYWVSYLNPLGKPSQSLYHVPRSWLKPKDNLLVLFEEEGGRPHEITIMTVKRDNICTFVSETYPGQVKNWARQESKFLKTVEDVKPEAHLQCSGKKVIKKVSFASFGNPIGDCGNYMAGSCHSPHAKIVVKKACLGKKKCVLPVSALAYGADPDCRGTTNTLAVQVKCSRPSKRA